MLVFKDKDGGIELIIGDVLILTDPKDDEGFYNSNIGGFFKKGICDTATLEVKQKPWLEIYFELKLKKDGKFVTEAMFYEEKETTENNMLFVENADYTFIRYCIKKGAKLYTGE